jgi:hypothetical protein
MSRVTRRETLKIIAAAGAAATAAGAAVGCTPSAQARKKK